MINAQGLFAMIEQDKARIYYVYVSCTLDEHCKYALCSSQYLFIISFFILLQWNCSKGLGFFTSANGVYVETSGFSRDGNDKSAQ